METTLKYYDDSRILAAPCFTLKIITQLFGAVTGDDNMRLDRIFFDIFLLVASIFFCLFHDYLLLTLVISWNSKIQKKFEKPKIEKKI